jgi:hypothetical protein
MDSNRGSSAHPVGSSTSTTTTTHGPHTTTTVHSTTPGQGTSVHHSGPQTTTITSPTVTTISQTPAPQSPAPSANPSRSDSQRVRSSSIRIRRPSSQIALPAPSPQPQLQQKLADDSTWQTGRRRSSSEPRPPSSVLFQDDSDLRRQMTATPLQPLYEDGSRTGNGGNSVPGTGPPQSRGPSTRRQGISRQISALNIRRNHHQAHHNQHNTMDSNVVDVLDVIGQFALVAVWI